jgi:hypothetical protein
VASLQGEGEAEADEDTDIKDVEGDAVEDEADVEDVGEDGEEGALDADQEAEASTPARSIHDSADDESELSDVPPDYEDHAPPGLTLMFPNLRRGADTGTGTAIGDDDSETK